MSCGKPFESVKVVISVMVLIYLLLLYFLDHMAFDHVLISPVVWAFCCGVLSNFFFHFRSSLFPVDVILSISFIASVRIWQEKVQRINIKIILGIHSRLEFFPSHTTMLWV